MRKFKGKLIVLDGPEGSGKSTQIALLYKYLKKRFRRVVCFREPGSTRLGEQIRRILLDDKKLKICSLSEMLLYQACRAQFVAEELLPALKGGYLILLDRFTSATLAYQGYGGGLSLKLIEDINEIAACGIKPDITVVLDIGVKEGLKRVAGRRDRMESKPLVFHRRVRRGYCQLAAKGPKIKIINGSGDIMEIQEKIREIVLDAIGKRAA